MEVNLVDCVQRTNGSDCGLFASAFLFEWATASVLTSLSVRIDVAKTRPHLVHSVLRCSESFRCLNSLQRDVGKLHASAKVFRPIASRFALVPRVSRTEV